MVRVSNRVCMMPDLTGTMTVVQAADEGLEGIITMLVEPAIGEVGILYQRHVRKAVFVLVH